MKQLGQTAYVDNHLFSLLPLYFKTNDSYKDIDNRGLLERYLNIFCVEIDDEVADYIDNVGLLADAENISALPHSDASKFLIHISDDVGNPPDIEDESGNHDYYEKLLRYVLEIYRVKGTSRSVELYLRLMGYTISNLIEYPASANKYDDSLSYDDSLIYDSGTAFYLEWELVITDLPGTSTKSPAQSWLDNYLKEAIETFLMPINTILLSVTYI